MRQLVRDRGQPRAPGQIAHALVVDEQPAVFRDGNGIRRDFRGLLRRKTSDTDESLGVCLTRGVDAVNSGFEGTITGLGGFRQEDQTTPTLVLAVARFTGLLGVSGESQIILTVPQD